MWNQRRDAVDSVELVGFLSQVSTSRRTIIRVLGVLPLAKYQKFRFLRKRKARVADTVSFGHIVRLLLFHSDSKRESYLHGIWRETLKVTKIKI